MAKPATVPEWASSDQVDGVSGQNNVVEPTTTFKTYGWPRKARPVRQYLNWLGRWTYEWITWISTEYDLFIADITTNAAAIAAETAARIAADTTLQGNIDAEAATRASEDSDLQDAIDVVAANLASEAATRAAADTALDDRLDEYDADTTETSGTMSLEGFAADQDINYYAQFLKHRATNGLYREYTEVMLWMPTVSANSTSNSLTIESTSIPSGLRPDVEQSVPFTLIDSGTSICGWIQLTTSGDWILRRYDNAAFSVAGTKGILAQPIRYRLQLITP